MLVVGNAYDDVGLFIRLDRIGAALAVVFVLVANLLLVREPAVWWAMPLLIVLNVGLYFASKRFHQQQVLHALILVAVSNWFVALTIPLFFPFLWPVMMLTVLMPLVLASPHLTSKQIVPSIVTAAVLASIVTAVGLLNDDGGVLEDIDDSIELVVVIGSIAAQIVPIGLVVWQHNEMQRKNVGRLTALNADLIASEGQLATSRDRVVKAADNERRRIERDLHDGAQQRLVALGVRLRLLQSQGHDDPVVSDGVTTVLEELDEAIREVRELAHGIYPPLLQTRGLPDALSAVTRRSPLDIAIELDPIDRLPEPVETALYFMALEGLANVTKHAPEAHVTVRLVRDQEQVSLTVSDNGPGFDPAVTEPSHGFHNITDRLAVVGGTLEVVAAPGLGTSLTASVPHPA